MSNDYVERHLYDAEGHTGNTYYIRIVNRGTSNIWNPTTEVMEDEADITWEESAEVLVEEGETGVFPIVIKQDWRTVEDIAMELYDTPLVDLPEVGIETVSQELYNEPVADLTPAVNILVVAEWEVRNADRIAVGTEHQSISNLPAGTYDIIVYQQLGSEPANDDDVEKQFTTKVGSIFGF